MSAPRHARNSWSGYRALGAREWINANMITLEDCIGLCGLTEEEVLAIAEHENLPELAATALAQYLLSQQHGSEKSGT